MELKPKHLGDPMILEFAGVQSVVALPSNLVFTDNQCFRRFLFENSEAEPPKELA